MPSLKRETTFTMQGAGLISGPTLKKGITDHFTPTHGPQTFNFFQPQVRPCSISNHNHNASTLWGRFRWSKYIPSHWLKLYRFSINQTLESKEVWKGKNFSFSNPCSVLFPNIALRSQTWKHVGVKLWGIPAKGFLFPLLKAHPVPKARNLCLIAT